MIDIFDHKILCESCGKQMQKIEILKNGFVLRALRCPQNHETIIHPEDKAEYENFIQLRKKNMKLK